jgi:hypothetical protein
MDLQQTLELEVDPAQIMTEIGLTADPWQAQALRSTAKRLLLLAARQLGKSTTISLIVLLAAVLRANAFVLLVSKTERQSLELLRKVTSYYHQLGDPVPVTREQANGFELANGARVLALPGDPDTIRCYSAVTLVVVDEASRAEDALFAAALPMLVASGGRLILASTPRGASGFFAEQWNGKDVEWEKIAAKASECPRIPRERLEEERKLHGERRYAEEYECAFLGSGGAVFTRVSECVDRGRTEDISLVTDPKLGLQMGVDIGRFNDATVVTILDNNGRQVYWRRFVETSFERQIEAIRSAFTAIQEHAATNLGKPIKLQMTCAVMDSTGIGLPIYEALWNQDWPIYPFVFTAASKIAVVERLAAALDNGQIRLQDHEIQEQELLAYQQERTPTGNYRFGAPPGQHDDCVIALALAWHGIDHGVYVDAGA